METVQSPPSTAQLDTFHPDPDKHFPLLLIIIHVAANEQLDDISDQPS